MSILARYSRLRSIRVLGPDGAELSEAELPARIVRLKPGDPAAAAELRAAQARIVDYFRNEGRPLAKVASVAPVVDHAAHVMDVTFTIDPGPIAPFGEATMNGPNNFNPAIARSFLYIHPGDPYSPRAIEDARNTIRQIPAVGGVRITEGTTLDAYGRLPYTVDVEDRLPYAVGASAKYSTTNGPAGQVYWEDRNVFGGAERLRLQADVFYAPPWFVTSQDIRSFSIDDIGWRFSASFLKPALWGTPNDLLVDALGERMSTSGAGFFGYRGGGRRRDRRSSSSLQPRISGCRRGSRRRPASRRIPRAGQLHAGRRPCLRQLRHDRQQARPDAGRAAQRLGRRVFRPRSARPSISCRRRRAPPPITRSTRIRASSSRA